MSMTIKAHFDGRVIVPDEPVELNTGEQVEVIIKERHRARTADERRAALKRITSRAVRANIPLEALRRENMYEDRI